jgi:hypothetical protein
MSPPRNKDKFAALAHQQQEKEQQQQGEAEAEPPNPSQPPMELSPPEPAEALEAVAAVGVGAGVEAEAPVVQPAPVKRDKFASMSAHQAAVGVAAAPKRDKFASMTAHRSGETPPSTPPAVAPTAPDMDDTPANATAARTTSIDSNTGASVPEPVSVAVAAPPRRDKFASMASRQQTGGAGGTSASDSVTTAVVVTLNQSQRDAAEEKTRSLQQRMDQRDAVWSDLCKAEAQTIQLLQTAQTTATHLAAAASSKENNDSDSKNNKHKNSSDDKASSSSDSDNKQPSGSSQVTANIQKCMKDYQSTVEQIHALLAPHADLVKAYQAPTRLNRMYQARVELRLADEKQNLLQEFLRLQKEEETAATATTTVTGGGSAAALEGVESESAKRKRPDE